MEAYYALDFVSLLLSKEMPRQAEQTLSQHLKQFVPPGSLDLVRVQAPPLQQATSVAAEQDSELVHTGWKIQSLNTTADTLMAAAARLTGEIEHETRYWQEVLAVHQKGWPLCRMPRERHTLGVNFGFMEGAYCPHKSPLLLEFFFQPAPSALAPFVPSCSFTWLTTYCSFCAAAADFRDRSLAALRRGVNGRIVLDQALSSASARDGKPRALRVRIGRRGTSSSSSSKGRPLIAIVGSSSAPMSTSTTATASSSSALSSEVRKENNHKDNDISDDHRRNNSEVAKGGSGGDSVANHDDELQSDNNADRSHDNAAAAASFPPVEDLIVQARNAIFEEELFHELAREARTLTNRGVRTRDATIMLPLPRAPPQQSRQAQPSAQQPPSSMPTFRLPFNRPFTQAPEDDVEEYIILDLLPLEEFPIATTTTDKRNVAQAPSGEARQQGGGGERREQEGRGGEELQRQGAGEGENYEEGHDEEDEEQEQEATFLAEGIALTLRILLARAHQLNLQRRSQPPPPLRAPDRANAPAAARGGGLALLPPPPPPPYAILRPVLARLSTPLAAPVPASFAAPPATSSSGVPNIASVSAQQPSDPTQQPPAFSFTAASAPSGPSAPPAPSASQAQPHAQSSTNSGQRHHHNLYYGRPRHLSGYTHHHEQLLLSLLSLMKSLTVSSPSSHPHSSSGKT
jgi:hypothetical protein